MNINEARFLLQTLAAVDQRSVADEIATTWASLLEDVDPRDGMAALKKLLQEQPDLFIRPGHIIAVARDFAHRRRVAEAESGPKYDPWGNMSGSPESDEARRQYIEARDERFNAPALPPPVKVVSSPYREWEKNRRQHARRADSPIITDIDKIEAAEATRRRYLQALRSMMTDEEREEVDRGVPQAGHIRGMAGDPDRSVPGPSVEVEPAEEGEEGV